MENNIRLQLSRTMNIADLCKNVVHTPYHARKFAFILAMNLYSLQYHALKQKTQNP